MLFSGAGATGLGWCYNRCRWSADVRGVGRPPSTISLSPCFQGAWSPTGRTLYLQAEHWFGEGPTHIKQRRAQYNESLVTTRAFGAAGRHWGLWEVRTGSWRGGRGTGKWGESHSSGRPTPPSAALVSSGPGPPPTVAREKGAVQMGARMSAPGLYPQADGGQEWEHTGLGWVSLLPTRPPGDENKLPCSPRVSLLGAGCSGRRPWSQEHFLPEACIGCVS